MIETLNTFRITELASKQLNKWIVVVSNGYEYPDGFKEDPLYLRLEEVRKKWESNFTTPAFLVMNRDFYIFEDEKLAWEFYDEFRRGLLADSCVYSCIVCPKRGIIDENT